MHNRKFVYKFTSLTFNNEDDGDSVASLMVL